MHLAICFPSLIVHAIVWVLRVPILCRPLALRLGCLPCAGCVLAGCHGDHSTHDHDSSSAPLPRRAWRLGMATLSSPSRRASSVRRLSGLAFVTTPRYASTRSRATQAASTNPRASDPLTLRSRIGSRPSACSPAATTWRARALSTHCSSAASRYSSTRASWRSGREPLEAQITYELHSHVYIMYASIHLVYIIMCISWLTEDREVKCRPCPSESGYWTSQDA